MHFPYSSIRLFTYSSRITTKVVSLDQATPHYTLYSLSVDPSKQLKPHFYRFAVFSYGVQVETFFFFWKKWIDEIQRRIEHHHHRYKILFLFSTFRQEPILL